MIQSKKESGRARMLKAWKTRRKNKPKIPMTVISLGLPVALEQKLKSKAKKQEQSVSAFVRHLIKQNMEK